MGHSLPPSLARKHKRKEGAPKVHSQVKAESDNPIAVLIIKATSKLLLVHSERFSLDMYFACFVEEASKSKKSNEEQPPRPMNSHTSLPPPRAQCLTGAGARLLAHPPIIGLDGQADGRILIMIVGPEPETCADCAVQKEVPQPMPSSTVAVGQLHSSSVQ